MADRTPNFLFFLPDQHRYDWIPGNEKLPLRMPNVERMAERGVVFERAVCPSPLCAPSRACLAAGKRHHECRVPSNKVDYPLDQPTHYQRLRDLGYQVCGVGKFDLHKNSYIWGPDGKNLIEEWGFTDGIDNEGKYDGILSGAETPKGPYLQYLHDRGLAEAHVHDFRTRNGFASTWPTPLPDEAYCDNWLSENGLRFLREFPEDSPWYLVVNFTGPHNPMDVTESMLRRWEGVDFPSPNRNDQHDEETHVKIRRNYAAMLENIDRQIGRFIDLVRRRGELDNTIIIYSSDHGEMLGDHNGWGKGTWYQPSVGVPLIVSGPGVQGGRRSDALAELQDLTATFLDYAGAEPLPGMDSRSLRPLLEGQSDEHREYQVSALRDWRMIGNGRYKLVLPGEDPPLLFDLVEDPLENENIADESPVLVKELTLALDQEQGRHLHG